ncbi:hypothetical protein NOCARDAX2BIS_830004 [Nocardioides sp. AX2bis]|nr:hypothetical protein NOCARDAX2BIS_830004 [Nocardioides sp. AX2bis]
MGRDDRRHQPGGHRPGRAEPIPRRDREPQPPNPAHGGPRPRRADDGPARPPAHGRRRVAPGVAAGEPPPQRRRHLDLRLDRPRLRPWQRGPRGRPRRLPGPPPRPILTRTHRVRRTHPGQVGRGDPRQRHVLELRSGVAFQQPAVQRLGRGRSVAGGQERGPPLAQPVAEAATGVAHRCAQRDALLRLAGLGPRLGLGASLEVHPPRRPVRVLDPRGHEVATLAPGGVFLDAEHLDEVPGGGPIDDVNRRLTATRGRRTGTASGEQWQA